MRRLIDADALKEKKVYSHERHEKIVPVAEIDWMPTTDAIPVEWLEEWRQDMEDAEQDFPAQAIRYVLWLWRAAKGR